MFGKLLFLFFCVSCSAYINIALVTSSFSGKTVVNFTGEDLKIVTDDDISWFNITKDNLNVGVRVELGKVPKDIFLKDPTPFDDLYKQYKWKQVTRKVIVDKIKTLYFKKSKEVLETCEYINNTTETINKEIDITGIVENRVEMEYPEQGLPDDIIDFGVEVDFENGKLNCTNRWRNTTVKAVKLPFRKTKGVIAMKKGQHLVAVLSAVKLVMLFEVHFKAYLIGNIIAHYAHLYGKYHFWAPTIQNIMKAANLQNDINTKVLMELRFYAEPKMTLIDKDINTELNINAKTLRKMKTKKPTTIKPITSTTDMPVLAVGRNQWACLNLTMTNKGAFKTCFQITNDKPYNKTKLN